jgi:hypothetical protein
MELPQALQTAPRGHGSETINVPTLSRDHRGRFFQVRDWLSLIPLRRGDENAIHLIILNLSRARKARGLREASRFSREMVRTRKKARAPLWGGMASCGRLVIGLPVPLVG